MFGYRKKYKNTLITLQINQDENAKLKEQIKEVESLKTQYKVAYLISNKNGRECLVECSRLRLENEELKKINKIIKEFDKPNKKDDILVIVEHKSGRIDNYWISRDIKIGDYLKIGCSCCDNQNRDKVSRDEKIEQINKSIDNVLEGIDQEESVSKNGWWETSDGAEFGKRKANELKNLIRNIVKTNFNNISQEEYCEVSGVKLYNKEFRCNVCQDNIFKCDACGY